MRNVPRLPVILFYASGGSVLAAPAVSHSDPIAAILVAAKLFGELSDRRGFPSVLGELMSGILPGNLVLINPAWAFLSRRA
jgi:hypothetical protein